MLNLLGEYPLVTLMFVCYYIFSIYILSSLFYYHLPNAYTLDTYSMISNLFLTFVICFKSASLTVINKS